MTVEPGTGTVQYQRQRDIYTLALSHGSVDVTALARQFNVTTETIRRDLSELQDRQLLRRVHGGAVLFEHREHEPRLDARDALNADEKRRIGRLAAQEVPEHGSVIIDSGSTAMRLAAAFPPGDAVHVFTNSLTTGAALVQRGVTSLTVIGGRVRTNTLAMVDAAAVEAVHTLRVDVVFLSCDGLSFTRGLTTPYSDEAMLKRAMIDSARRVVVLLDQSKFGNDQLFNFARLDDIDVLITDTRADDAAVEVIQARGVEVRRA